MEQNVHKQFESRIKILLDHLHSEALKIPSRDPLQISLQKGHLLGDLVVRAFRSATIDRKTL